MVQRHVRHYVPQQARPLPGEDQEGGSQGLLRRLCWYASLSLSLSLPSSSSHLSLSHHLAIISPLVPVLTRAGGKNYDNAVDYLKQKFVKLNRNQHKVIYVHVTCATDTDNIRFVFNAVKDIIVRESMQKSDLL
mmetsp:Transcript_12011/g.48377  ORF Transcript_12011/g.48377 Transcript_12011/m.48377 type:complete len:134 (-) Transcript_12011:133-534(-)